MTRLDWALLLTTPAIWFLCCWIVEIFQEDEDESATCIVAGCLTLACWGVYLGWGRA